MVAPSSQPVRLEIIQGGLDSGLVFKLTQHGKYDRHYQEACEQWKCDPFVLKGLHETESGQSPTPVRGDTLAAGISQFVPSGAAAVGNLQRRRGVKRPFRYVDALDPVKSIHAAAELLNHLVDYCRVTNDNLAVLLSAYNTGKCGARRESFVLRVVKHTNRFRTMGGIPPMPEPEMWWKKSKRRTPRSRLTTS